MTKVNVPFLWVISEVMLSYLDMVATPGGWSILCDHRRWFAVNFKRCMLWLSDAWDIGYEPLEISHQRMRHYCILCFTGGQVNSYLLFLFPVDRLIECHVNSPFVAATAYHIGKVGVWIGSKNWLCTTSAVVDSMRGSSLDILQKVFKDNQILVAMFLLFLTACDIPKEISRLVLSSR